MTKFSHSDRLRAVSLVLDEGFSIVDVSMRLGTVRSQVQRWLSHYEAHGASGLSMRWCTYSVDFKLAVILHKRKNDLSLRQTAADFGIPSESRIFQWERLYDRHGLPGLSPKQRGRRPAMTDKKPKKHKPADPPSPYDALVAENERLRAEVAYLKKLRALVEERIARESGRLPKPSKD